MSNDTDSDIEEIDDISVSDMDIKGNKLYENCFKMCNVIFHESKNERDLDKNLYNKLVQNPLLNKYKHIFKGDINELCEFFEPEAIKIENIDTYFGEGVQWICRECKSIIPIDMDFYSEANQPTFENNWNENKQKIMCICQLCYNDEKYSSLNKVKINSGLISINDWIFIFRTNQFHFYCNLNKKSEHYKKFLRGNYIGGLGDEFKIIPETSLEEIFNRYDIAFDSFDHY